MGLEVKNAPKIIVKSSSGLARDLTELGREWMAQGVKFVGFIGRDSAELEEALDRLCFGNGAMPYEMLSASFDSDETLEDALELSKNLSVEMGSETHVVEF